MADDTRSVPAALGTQRNNAEYCTGRQATLKQALSEHIAILDALATRRSSSCLGYDRRSPSNSSPFFIRFEDRIALELLRMMT